MVPGMAGRTVRNRNQLWYVILAFTLGALGLVATEVAQAATVGPGTMTVTPASVAAGSTGNTFTLRYTAPTTGAVKGAIAVLVPTSGAPNTGFQPLPTSANVAVQRGNCTSAALATTPFTTATKTNYPGDAPGTQINVTVNCKAGHTFTLTYTNATAPRSAQDYTFFTTVDTVPIAGRPAVTVVPGMATGLTVSAPATATAGTPFSVTVSATDAFANTASGYRGTIAFSSTDPNSPVLPASYTFTATDAGVHAFSGVVLRGAGTRTITAAGSSPSVTGTSGSIVVAPGVTTGLGISAPATATAGTAVSVTVAARDAAGNVAPSYGGTVAFSSTDGKSPVLPADYTFTAADAGVHTFVGVVLKDAGTSTISVVDRVDTSISATSGSIVVAPGAATQLVVAAPSSATSGTAFDVTVTAQDAFANPASAYTGGVAFTSTDSAAVLPGSYTFTAADAGVHAFTGVVLQAGGSRTISATDQATASITGTSGPIVVVVVSGPAVRLGSSAPATTTAGVGMSVLVVARDVNGNVASSYRGGVTFSSTDTNSPVLPADYTFTSADAGVHTFTGVVLKAAGTRTISVTDQVTASITGTSGSIAVAAGPTTRLGIAPPATVTAGAPVSVLVVARDAYSNVASSYRGGVTFSSTDTKSPVLPADFTFTSAEAGIHNFTGVVLKDAGTRTISVTDQVTASITGTSGPIVVAPGAATQLAVVIPSTVSSGTAFDVRVTARDAFANTATGYTGTVAFTSDDTGSPVLPGNYAFTGTDSGTRLFTGVKLTTSGTRTVVAWDTVTSTITGSASTTVSAAALSRLVLTPASATIVVGGAQAYTAEGFDAANNSLGDVTSATTFTVDGAPCPGALCSPTAVGDRTVTGVDGVATGTAVLHVDAAVVPGLAAFGWGYNAFGQLGDGTTTDRLDPVQVGTSAPWASIAAGWQHTVAVRTDGTLWAWGFNASGQLGDGTTTDRSGPVQVGTATTWASVAAGAAHTVAVRTDGSLWAWGDNSSGQLGDGTTTSRLAPVRIGTATAWTSVSGGSDHSVAVRTDGTLWAWGLNSSGQLGDGTTTSRLAPVRIGTATTWASVAAGAVHTMAVRTDGTLWGWGYNGSGQVGDGTTTSRLAPVQVGTVTTWASVAASPSHTAAVRTDGTLWAWGDNGFGQLGDGSFTSRSAPIRVGTSTIWASVAAGADHTAGIRTDGTLWGWGYNGSGQLGDGTISSRTKPVKVGTGTSWRAVSAGYDHTVGLQS